ESASPSGFCSPNRFYAYGVIARLPLLAAAQELEKSEGRAEVLVAWCGVSRLSVFLQLSG
ncbi:MAG: hypothetical protein ABI284_04270, partial [Nitrosospira sp.]